MLQAVEAPLLKVAAVAGAAAIGLMLALAPSAATQAGEVRRLVLHAPEAANAIYLTAWECGDVYVTVPAGEPREMTFETRARVWDGCEWLATERLVPHGKDLYLYSYEEEVLSCAPGATPTSKTPRTGFVVSVPAH